VKKIVERYPIMSSIIQKILAHGGRSYLVGGVVRDMVMGLSINDKDIDVEVHGLTEHMLENILQEYGVVNTVGKSFGVLRVSGLAVDWSLPRTDSTGRKPIVTIDPGMTIQEAARRRDLTMNAMAIDMQTGELIDPFGGKDDIKNKILRAPDARLFIQDPLRLFRVMQFIGRFEMVPDSTLNELCSSIDITSVSRERIEQEFKKLLLLSERPSLGIRWLHSIKKLPVILQELAGTLQVQQNPKWHPEGTVFEHTMQALDAAAQIVQSYDQEKKKLIILYAALCHDIGKVTTTTVHDGVIKSIGHENETGLVKTLLKRITHDTDIIEAVVSLVLHHMQPLQFVAQNAKLPAYKRLARKLSPLVSMKLLADLARADRRGRNGASSLPLADEDTEVDVFIKNAQKAGVFELPEAAVLTGADILAYVKPGPQVGHLLKKAYDIQINEGIIHKEDLLKRLIGKKMK